MCFQEPFQHESLLVDRADKKLSLAEKRMAKRGYELEKQASLKPTYGLYTPLNMQNRYTADVDAIYFIIFFFFWISLSWKMGSYEKCDIFFPQNETDG